MDAVIQEYPAACRVFNALESDRLHGVGIIQLHGPAGCLKRDVAKLCVTAMGLQPVFIGWMDLRMRADKVLNALVTRRVDGKKRGVTISVHDGFMQRERLLGLLEYTADNVFFVCTTARLSIPSVDFSMFPLSLTDLEVMLKRLSKKCAWAYHKDMLEPMYRYTDGIPAKIVNVIRASQHEATAARVVKMIEERKENKVAENLYATLTAGATSFTDIAKVIDDALQKVGWVELAERLQERIRTDILSGVALHESALQEGAWKILDEFDPTTKNKFVSGCFKIASTARGLK